MKIVILPPDLRWNEDTRYPDKWISLKDIETIFDARNDGSIIKLISNELDLINADWIIFIGWYAWSYKWYGLVLKNKLINKSVYWMHEPEVVNPQHNKEGVERILRRFKYIMTWNKNLVDDNRVLWLNIPYNWKIDVDSNVFYNTADKHKLLTNITANKTSLVEGELYTEREKIIKWFEDNHPDKFMFYGNGWEKNKYITYGGTCGNKKDVYQEFKFALCIENASVVDCLSEKIMDCLTSGVVPIYKGAPNITDYIPQSCFIDYNKFNSYDDLYAYLENMPNTMYEEYISNIKHFILNTEDIEIFSPQKWIECFDYLSIKNEKSEVFEIKPKGIVEFMIEYFIFDIKYLLYKLFK